MFRSVTRLATRILHLSRERRRGTVLLLALGVLGILSIAAISYVTIIRLDRASAEAGSRRASFQQQPDAVVAYIGSLLAADLTGNKIVTAEVPADYWPRMFEDGDTRDYPLTDLARNTFDTNNPGSFSASADAILPATNNNDNTPALQQRIVGYPDDAWLASYDPDWNPAVGNPQATNRWPQITNLRSAYSWKPSTTGAGGQWVRDNGRFVDLGQWFIQANYLAPTQAFPNPGVQLMKWNTTDGVSADGQLGPAAGVNQMVFQNQVNVMARITPPVESTPVANGSVDPLTPRDERQWVDTDGDLRPDARWQQLDVLGNLFGLNWVVAARIVDASALVNVNTALESGSAADPATQADGRTPADVDLYRLIVGAGVGQASTSYARRVRSGSIDRAFAEWINTDLDMQGILTDAKNNFSSSAFGASSTFFDPLLNLTPWSTANHTRRIDREAFYHYFASNPQKPTTARGTALPVRDIIDLAAFMSSNNTNMVSRTEQRFDGPAINGYLPDGTTGSDYGPLRSREQSEDIRRFATAPETANNRLPTSQQIKESRRRLFTTISGDAPFMPIPVLNTGPNSAFRGRSTADPKIPLDASLTDDGVRRAFEAFVWALAPLATDLPLDRGMRDANAFNLGDARYHYGGGTTGPAELFRQAERFYPAPTTAATPPIPAGQADASFATITAASLAANLKDALDVDGRPSVLRVMAQAFAVPGAPALVPGSRHATDRTKPLILTSEFVHGAIDPMNLKAIGAPVALPALQDPTRGGITVVGLERQPYLSEVTTLAIYSDALSDNYGGATFPGGNNNHVVGDIIDEQLGSAIVIELFNPWPTPILLDGYSVIIPESENVIGDNATSFSVTFPNSFLLDGGATGRFYWLLEADGVTSAWTEIRDALLAKPIFANALELDDNALSVAPSLLGKRIPFQNVLDNRQRRPVLLVYDRRMTDIPPLPGFIVDRMAPDAKTMSPALPPDEEVFPRGLPGGVFNLASDGDEADNLKDVLSSGFFTFDNYFGPAGLGYVTSGAGPPPFDNKNAVDTLKQVTGRVTITSTLSRPGIALRSSAGGGFPAMVIEVPNGNHVVHRKEAHAWIYPFTPTAFNPPPATSETIPADTVNAALVAPIDFPAKHSTIGIPAKFADDATVNTDRVDPAKIAAFQLYVPSVNTGPTGVRLNALSELHMLSSYAHTCRSRDAGAPRAWEEELADLQNWQTVGEKMGLSLLRNFGDLALWDPATQAYPTPTPLALNPYLGTLDPSRFIPGSAEMGLGLSGDVPDTMRIPLALRVFDCFWPASLNSVLAQGRININTAPAQVLECLPLIAPQYPIGGVTLSNPARVDFMLDYRAPDRQLNAKNTIGIRDLRSEVGGRPQPQGFATTGELAILDTWDQAVPGQVAANAIRWLELAEPNNFVGEDTPPLEMVTGADYVDVSYNPVNDPEERLALYRAVSNIVSTRSDVFLAWFVIRGYEPAVIERIPINGASVQNRLSAMDDETFRPAYESRWLVVYDRSNIRRPTDRPNVLLQVELPRATP